MLERRNSARIPLQAKIRETNGDYFYTWNCANLSEDGIFLINKFCFNSQEPYSKVSFSLPDGTLLQNLTARIIRETRKGEPKGCALEFLNLTEDQRISLKRFFFSRVAS